MKLIKIHQFFPLSLFILFAVLILLSCSDGEKDSREIHSNQKIEKSSTKQSQKYDTMWVGQDMMVIPESGLNLRKDPGVDGEKLLTIPYDAIVHVNRFINEQVEINGVSGYWAYIEYEEGQKSTEGWVFDAYLGPVKITDCLSLDDLESQKLFYVNFISSTGTSYYRDRFDFYQDKTGTLHRAVESRGTIDAGEFPFRWEKKEKAVVLKFDDMENFLVCSECTEYEYDGPDTDLEEWGKLREECSHKCEARYLEKYGKTKALFSIEMVMTESVENQVNIGYHEKELDRLEGKDPWKVEFLYSSWKRNIDIRKDVPGNLEYKFSCFTTRKVGS